jgi:hypothetical protein
LPLFGGIALASLASFYIHHSISPHSLDTFLNIHPVDNELYSHGITSDKVFENFLSHIAKYNKIYKNQKEFETRFSIFKKKLS